MPMRIAAPTAAVTAPSSNSMQKETPVPPSPDRREALSVTMVDASERESKMSVQRMAELLDMRMNGQNPTSIQESLGVFAETPRPEDSEAPVQTKSGLVNADPSLQLENLVLDENMAGSDLGSEDTEDAESVINFEDYVFCEGDEVVPDMPGVVRVDSTEDDETFGQNIEIYRSDEASFLHTLKQPVEIIAGADAGHGEDLFVPLASKTNSKILQFLSKMVRKTSTPDKSPVNSPRRYSPRSASTSLQSPHELPKPTVSLPSTPAAGSSSLRLVSTSQRITINSLEELEHLRTLGQGLQGTVYLARHKPSKFLIAVKVEQAKERHRPALRREIRIQCGLTHQNIVKFYGSFFNDDEKRLHTLTQYMDGGSIYSAIQLLGPIPESILSQIIGGCLSGLRYMHERNIMHRDIKTQNVLLSLSETCAKLTDFGHSKSIKNQSASFLGTIEYMSPERLDGKSYTYAADIWSLGLCVVEGYLGHHPFTSRPAYWNYVESAKKGDHLFAEYHVEGTIELNDFVSACTQQTSFMRPTAEKLLSHPWIRRHRGNRKDLHEWFERLSVAMECKAQQRQVAESAPL